MPADGARHAYDAASSATSSIARATGDATDAAQGRCVPQAFDEDPGKTAREALTSRQIADKPSPSAGFLFFNGVMLKTPMPTQHELEM
ncbi:hypothetical protein, partial [Burkholderia pseudomallei]|uniref:hypothetical protein n=1 Tax=Burkholderia pseudomallei TaxID=28450 RepID=UPI001C83E8DB